MINRRFIVTLWYRFVFWLVKLLLPNNHHEKRAKQTKRSSNKESKIVKEWVDTPQDAIYEWAIKTNRNNSVTRQLQPSCHALHYFDKNTPLNKKPLKIRLRCYGCNQPTSRNHPNYVFSCRDCGNKYQKNRHLTRNLTGYTAVVIGARTKLGHQVVIKLLNAGAFVIGTTRFPEKALELYEKYEEWEQWKEKLSFYDKPFDLDVANIAEKGKEMADWIPGN